MKINLIGSFKNCSDYFTKDHLLMLFYEIFTEFHKRSFMMSDHSKTNLLNMIGKFILKIKNKYYSQQTDDLVQTLLSVLIDTDDDLLMMWQESFVSNISNSDTVDKTIDKHDSSDQHQTPVPNLIKVPEVKSTSGLIKRTTPINDQPALPNTTVESDFLRKRIDELIAEHEADNDIDFDPMIDIRLRRQIARQSNGMSQITNRYGRHSMFRPNQMTHHMMKQHMNPHQMMLNHGLMKNQIPNSDPNFYLKMSQPSQIKGKSLFLISKV